MKFLILIFSLLVIVSCQNEKEEQVKQTLEQEVKQVEVNESNAGYASEVFLTDGKGWGYVITSNGKPFINQPHIPSVPGNQGFETEEKATITAMFIINKLNNGILPPSITKEELDSLGVL